MPDASSASPASYRFGFVLTTAAGNQTRYLNLKKYAERDPSVACTWAPISHYLDPDPYRRLPAPLRTRLIVAKQARPVMRRLSSLDAVMFHAFEPYLWTALRARFHVRPLLVWSQDNPPLADPSRHPQAKYGGVHEKSDWRASLRLRLDLWCARRTALFLPFSRWAADVLVSECGIPADKVEPIHVGLDLEEWDCIPMPAASANRRLQILFVGGDFERKGGPNLVEVFGRHFVASADLHLVTIHPPAKLPEHTFVHSGLTPNDLRLKRLYADCDIFVLPTRADMSSWVAMEAMATSRPVIISGTGGIPDLVAEGETGFLIEPDNPEMLLNRLQILAANAELRLRMGQAGRAFVERNFSASVNVPRILERMKEAVRHP